MKNRSNRDALIAAILVIATLVPFVKKAFHIDDPLFLWMAQQIIRHPGDPYGFTVNWYLSEQPMSSIMQNPPLSSYYMALMASFLGWSEEAMHSAFLVPALAAILGTFFLARRLSNSALLAALLLLFTPVFLVSATGVMCDLWLLAFWVWSIECWMRGQEEGRWWLLFLAAILTSAAALSKYFGISLVPLLCVYTLVRERKLSGKLLYLLIPIAIISSYEVITKAKYGQGLFSSAMLYSWKVTAKSQSHLLQQLLIGLSFTGGCLFSVLFYVPLIKSRRDSGEAVSVAAQSVFPQRARPVADKVPGFRMLLIWVAIFAIVSAVSYFGFVTATSSKVVLIGPAMHRVLFTAMGTGILMVVFAEIIQRRTADSLLLGLWVLGTFAFAAMMNWSITARTFLPMAPAVIILLIRRLGPPTPGGSVIRSLLLLPAALLSLLITIGDYELAKTARSASNYFQERFRAELGTVWFEGHWGFQYYMQQWNAKPVDINAHKTLSGDVLVIPINNTNIVPPSAASVMSSPKQVNFPQFRVTTMNSELDAGFYSSVWGALPWAIGRVPPEPYLIFRIK